MLTNGCTEGLLLVAHGSSSPAGVDEALALGAAVASACPDLHVDLGFLELADPPAGSALDRLVDRGCDAHHRAAADAARRRPRQERRTCDRARRPRPPSVRRLGVRVAARCRARAPGDRASQPPGGRTRPVLPCCSSRAARPILMPTPRPAAPPACWRSGRARPTFTSASPASRGPRSPTRSSGWHGSDIDGSRCSSGSSRPASSSSERDARSTSSSDAPVWHVVDAGYFGPEQDLVAVIEQRRREALARRASDELRHVQLSSAMAGP